MEKQNRKTRAAVPASVKPWSSLAPVDEAERARRRKRVSVDNFTSFTWRGESAYEKFGAFIVSGAGELRFNHGADFQNEYTVPRYEEGASSLLGVTFSTPQISFKVGLYYISEEEFRRFVYWLNPYEISWLSYGFEPKWQYQCKLNKMTDVSRYVLTGQGGDGHTYYYAETTLTFDVLGGNRAYGIAPREFRKDTASGSFQCMLKTDVPDFQPSDLEFPLKIRVSLCVDNILKALKGQTTEQNNKFNISCSTAMTDTITTELFNITFQHLTAPIDTDVGHTFLNFIYDSKTGLVYYSFGSATDRLLTLQETVSSGYRLLDRLKTTKFSWGGAFDGFDADYYRNQALFKITTTTNSGSSAIDNSTGIVYGDETSMDDGIFVAISVEGLPSTNVI